jgi:hypothetical protein
MPKHVRSRYEARDQVDDHVGEQPRNRHEARLFQKYDHTTQGHALTPPAHLHSHTILLKC